MLECCPLLEKVLLGAVGSEPTVRLLCYQLSLNKKRKVSVTKGTLHVPQNSEIHM